MNRSIFQIWQPNFKYVYFLINFLLKNLLIILLCIIFFNFFKLNTVGCDGVYKIVVIESSKLLYTEGIDLTRLINSRTNFINLWTPHTYVNQNLIKFTNLNGVEFLRNSPLNHPHVSIFNDILNNVSWNLQFTHSINDKTQNLFELFSNFDFFRKQQDQYISKNFRLVDMSNFKLKPTNIDISEEISASLDAKVKEIIIQQNLTPNWMKHS